MKRKLLRIENLLLLVPLIGLAYMLYDGWFAYYGANQFESQVIIRDRTVLHFYLLLSIDVIFNTFSVILPLYMMHYFLRAIRKRDKRVCVIHVLTTVLFSLYMMNYTVAFSVVPGWHTTIYPTGFLGSAPFWAEVLFWLLQAAFIIYGFITIHRWRKSLP
jgi:hypothetical protein